MGLSRFKNHIRVLAAVLIPLAFITTAWGAPPTTLDRARAAERELAVTAAVTDFDGDCPGGGAPPCDDITSSLGKFLILVHPTHASLLTGCPGWDGMVLESPLLSHTMTIIGRSAPHLDGSTADTLGTPVGSAEPIVMVSDDSFSIIPAGFEGPAGTREVHTELVSLLLSHGSGAEVRAGDDTVSITLRSFGEVESQSSSGLPGDDFPAKSFFNIFVEVTIPACGSGGFPGATVINSLALVVTNDNLTTFPPKIVYLHGGTPAVPVAFLSDGPGDLWSADDFFGWLILAGHGVGFDGTNEADVDLFLSIVGGASRMATPTVGCDGTESTGTGAVTCDAVTRDYAYPVTDPDGTMTDVYIGTDDFTPGNYTSPCMPPGWTFAIEPNDRSIKHDKDKTAHGGTSFPTAFCPFMIHFSDGGSGGGLPGGVWTFGFDNPYPSHDVGWVAVDSIAASETFWSEPVGGGMGPVHAPINPIPAVSTWGLIILFALLLCAGTIAVMRRRPAASGINAV